MSSAHSVLTITIPTVDYFVVALLAGYCIARWRATPVAQAAGGTVMWLSPLMVATLMGWLQFTIAPTGAMRIVEAALTPIDPVAAYDVFAAQNSFRILLMQLYPSLKIVRHLDWLGVTAVNALLMGLLLLASYAIRPLVPSGGRALFAARLPQRWRGLVDNPWPAKGDPRHWRINLALILMCTAPWLAIGPAVALYLRVRAPRLLWPASWVAALWQLGTLVTMTAAWFLNFTGLGAVFQLPEMIAWSLVTVALAVIFGATVPRAQATWRSRVVLALFIVLALAYQPISLRLEPDHPPPKPPEDPFLEYLRSLQPLDDPDLNRLLQSQ